MEIRQLEKNYNIDSICIETQEAFEHLRAFLYHDGQKYIQSRLCSIYAAIDSNKIIGYISIGASMIRMKETFYKKISIQDLENIEVPIPSILIGKLLICDTQQGKKYGHKLLSAIISHIYDISHELAIRFIIVDANKQAIGFYEKHGFIGISDSGKTMKMVLDLSNFEK